jgi:LacI family transcriptional regulator
VQGGEGREGRGMARGRRATLKDIAKEAGVHFSTASRALHPKKTQLVAEGVRARIVDIAENLGYTPNRVARGLKTRRTQSIGVLVSDITNDVFPPIIKGIETQVMPHGYVVMVANTDGSAEKEALIVDEFLDRGIDALIIASAYRREETISRASREGAVIVALNRAVRDDTISSILHDDAFGMRKLVEHVYALGHQNLAFVSGPGATWTGKERLDAFLHWSGQFGIRPEKRLIVETTLFTEDDGVRAANLLLSRSDSITAIMTANDDLACGVLQSLEDHGLTCPDDMSVTGFNDLPIAHKLRPALTTVRVDHYRSGLEVANILLKRLQNPGHSRAAQRVRLPTELVVRNSTRLLV